MCEDDIGTQPGMVMSAGAYNSLEMIVKTARGMMMNVEDDIKSNDDDNNEHKKCLGYDTGGGGSISTQQMMMMKEDDCVRQMVEDDGMMTKDDRDDMRDCVMISKKTWCKTHDCVVKCVPVTSKKWEYIKSKKEYGFVSRKHKKYYCRIKRFGPGDPSDVSHRLGTGVQQQGGSMARDNNGVHSVRQMAPNFEK